MKLLLSPIILGGIVLLIFSAASAVAGAQHDLLEAAKGLFEVRTLFLFLVFMKPISSRSVAMSLSLGLYLLSVED